MTGTLAPLSVDQAAQLLLCAPDTVRDMARSGELPGIKPGRDWVFPAGAFFTRLDELARSRADERRTPPQPAAQVHAMPARKAQRGARNSPPTLPSL